MAEQQVIVRPDEDGKPDDIVIDCDSIHLERDEEADGFMRKLVERTDLKVQ